MTLQVGDLAPDFTLLDADGTAVTLSAWRGQPVVLYFYPRDNTPGCTKEACGFRDLYPQFQAAGIQVLGISADDAKAHGKFRDKFQLPFPLLCDPEAQVARLYGSYGKKKFMGKEYEGVMRHTFVVDGAGRLQKIYRTVKPEPHPAQVWADLLGHHG
ncbi:MAG: thioredoxin-dependent thiol peroxidase [Oscillatoriales cyanobacterium SM2_1_8]|nr:thioredoxin-dependent thiol peroxidase [Oscillatoriales cyanobacterium SM2_1_8]